jgi:hypothetical protein
MKYMYLPVLIATLLLVGCSSAPKGTSFIDTTKELKPQEGLIKICRPSTIVMAAQSPEVFINGYLVADIVNDSVIEIPMVGRGLQVHVEFRPPGPKKFGINVRLNPQEEKYILMGTNVSALLPIPLPTAFIGVMSYRWEAANVDEAVFKEKCADLKTTRIRSLFR